MAYVIGIDIGTSGTKTLLVDETGKVAASATQSYALSQPKVDWSEQDPADWWAATVATVRTVLARSGVSAQQVKALGLSGQMHGAVALDEAGNVLRPAILWNDQRTAAECEEIESTLGRDRLIACTHNVALAGFTAPKILWIRKHEPRLWEKVRKILLPKDYIRYRLSGDFATEVSDASGTLLFDVKNRCWSAEVLSGLQIDPDLMPICSESVVATTAIHASAAEETGLVVGTPIVGGGGDQAAGAVGSGVVRNGILSATLGTSGVVFAHADEPVCDPLARVHSFCHAVPGKWHIMGVMLSAGGSFQWYRDTFAETEKAEAERRDVDVYDILCETAKSARIGSEGLIFLPYLTGERCPHPDSGARGAWVGLTRAHGKPEMIRSLLEGVTFGMRDCLQLVRDLNVPVAQIRISGGGARSPFWRQMQADIYETSVSRINVEEGPAFGVALLAAVAAGFYDSVEEACEATIQVEEITDVKPLAAELYNSAYKQYRALYPALKDSFHRLAELSG